jgi:hypothetical protein
MPRPGGYTLVLNPIMFSKTHTCRFSRVLIDGGSNINLLYRTSMEKLGIPPIQLRLGVRVYPTIRVGFFRLGILRVAQTDTRFLSKKIATQEFGYQEFWVQVWVFPICPNYTASNKKHSKI